MPKITTFLTYATSAEEAAKLYVDTFENSRIVKTLRYGEGSPFPKGTAMTVEFELDGKTYVALNGGPHFKFSEGISLSVECETQEQIDRYTEKLLAGGGEQGPCGWLKDRFGVSWQVNPSILPKLLGDADPAKSGRAMAAMMTMKKFDIAALKRAFEGG